MLEHLHSDDDRRRTALLVDDDARNIFALEQRLGVGAWCSATTAEAISVIEDDLIWRSC
jgi:hypothetical protein